MAIDAQRIHGKAERLRAERAERQVRQSDPDDDPDIAEGPVSDEESVIARTEALSAMVPPEQMRGYATEEAVFEKAEGDLTDIGRELSQRVDDRLDEWRSQLGAELDAVAPGSTNKSFVFGSLYGAAVCLGSLAGALILAKINRRD